MSLIIYISKHHIVKHIDFNLWHIICAYHFMDIFLPKFHPMLIICSLNSDSPVARNVEIIYIDMEMFCMLCLQRVLIQKKDKKDLHQILTIKLQKYEHDGSFYVPRGGNILLLFQRKILYRYGFAEFLYFQEHFPEWAFSLTNNLYSPIHMQTHLRLLVEKSCVTDIKKRVRALRKTGSRPKLDV